MNSHRRSAMSRQILNRPALKTVNGTEVGRPLTDAEQQALLEHDVERLNRGTLLGEALNWIALKQREAVVQLEDLERNLDALRDQQQELLQQQRFLVEQRQQLIDQAAAEQRHPKR